MENKSLPVILHDLSNSIINEVKSSKENKKLNISKELNIKEKILNLNYSQGITGFQQEPEIITKEKWRWEDELEFKEKIEASEAFQEAIKKIVKTYNVEEKKAKSWIIEFENKITNLCFYEINNEKIIELVSLFISDLEENPILWRPVVWIDGIWLETDSIEIRDNNNFLLRKPEPKDLEIEYPYGSSIYRQLNNWPSAILEFEYREKNSYLVQEKIDSIISTLRLFKLGSIERLQIQLNSDSIIRSFGGTIGKGNKIVAHHKYGLAEEDTEILKEFITIIEDLVHSEIIDKSTDEADYITIAYERFCDGLLKPVIPENRIASAIMALEALYLKEPEKSELTEKLSLRVAIALEPFGHKTLEVYNIVKRAYGIRSRFVHGSKVEQKEIGELPENILDYCRVSIIMFLQLHKELEKEKLINLLNKSLLDHDEKDKFHKLINAKCPIH